jgi:hypothetical protein
MLVMLSGTGWMFIIAVPALPKNQTSLKIER